MTVSVRYVDSAGDSADPHSIYNRLIESATGQRIEFVTDARAHVDLEMVSVHASEFSRVAKTIRSVVPGRNYRRRLRRQERWNAIYRDPSTTASHSLWFTGDNVRPPGGPWDGYLSCDLDPLGGRNVYFPHWWEYVGLLDSYRPSYAGLDMSVAGLMSERTPSPRPPGFVCAFIGNPTPPRLHAIDALSRIGNVDIFGNSVGRPVPSKVEIARNYRFVLCFENDLYPGYVTEKPFEAWATGAVPLWWGDDPVGYLSESAVVNAATFASLEEFADAVAHIDADESRRAEMVGRPVLAREPDLSVATGLMRAILIGD